MHAARSACDTHLLLTRCQFVTFRQAFSRHASNFFPDADNCSYRPQFHQVWRDRHHRTHVSRRRRQPNTPSVQTHLRHALIAWGPNQRSHEDVTTKPVRYFLNDPVIYFQYDQKVQIHIVLHGTPKHQQVYCYHWPIRKSVHRLQI